MGAQAWASRGITSSMQIADLELVVEARTLLQSGQASRMPLVRKQLAISLTALRALGGPTIEAAAKLVAEPPLFEAKVLSGVLNGLDEVDRALEGEVAV